MNDDSRRRVYFGEVLRCDAYMLFYVRSTPRQDPPVVPQSHVTPPSTRKRCAPLSPLEEGEVEDGEISSDLDSVPLCKRAKYQAQQNGDLLQANAPVGQQLSHAADAGFQANTGTLSQRRALHANGHSDGRHSMPNGSHASKLSPQEAEGVGEGTGGLKSAVSGASFIGPLNQPPPVGMSTPVAAPNRDTPTHQHRHKADQSVPSANGSGWSTADVNPDWAAAKGPDQTAANSPSAAAISSPKRFGFLGFALPTALNKGRSPSNVSLVAASDSRAACVTPPSQKLNSASSHPDSHGLPLSHGHQSLEALPIDPLLPGDKLHSKAGHKRSRVESGCDVELVLEDEISLAQDSRPHMPVSQNPPAPPRHPAASKQFMSESSGSLPALHRTHGQTDSKISAKSPAVSSHPSCNLLRPDMTSGSQYLQSVLEHIGMLSISKSFRQSPSVEAYMIDVWHIIKQLTFDNISQPKQSVLQWPMLALCSLHFPLS